MKIRRQRQTNRIKSKTSDELVNIDLQLVCSCEKSDENALIQFNQRFLQCRNSMPIGIVRQWIQTILCLSPKVKIFIFDVNHRMLKDYQRLSSLRETSSISTNFHIPLRFTLINTITDLTNCSCSTSSKYSFSSSLIEKENLDGILSTFKRKTFVDLSETMINEITSTFGEICPSIDSPVDLSMKHLCKNFRRTFD